MHYSQTRASMCTENLHSEECTVMVLEVLVSQQRKDSNAMIARPVWAEALKDWQTQPEVLHSPHTYKSGTVHISRRSIAPAREEHRYFCVNFWPLFAMNTCKCAQAGLNACAYVMACSKSTQHHPLHTHRFCIALFAEVN